jgi:hypothetical protein
LLRTSTVCIEWNSIIPKSVIALHAGEIEYYWRKWVNLSENPENLKFNINWQLFSNIRELEFDDSIQIYNDFFRLFPNLQFLSLYGPFNNISDESLIGLTNLRYLSFSSDPVTITNKSIKTLTNLESLIYPEGNDLLTDEGIRGLTKLTCLYAAHLITNSTLDSLKNLRSLYLDIGLVPTNFLRRLTNLTSLCIDDSGDMKGVRAFEINRLTNLITLKIINLNGKIKNENLSNLTNLTSLKLSDGIHNNSEFSFEGIKPLTKLNNLQCL